MIGDEFIKAVPVGKHSTVKEVINSMLISLCSSAYVLKLSKDGSRSNSFEESRLLSKIF